LNRSLPQKPKGIAVTAVNSTALADTINSAIEQGISVVCFDSDSPTSNRSAYLGTGNYAAGQKAAEFLVPLVNYKGKIAVLYTVGAENSESRVQGFEDWCKQNAPEVSLVKVNDAGDTTVAADNLAAAYRQMMICWCILCRRCAGTAGPTAVAESKKDLKFCHLTLM